MMLALLPGMEEETGDFFERVSVHMGKANLGPRPVEQHICSSIARLFPAQHTPRPHILVIRSARRFTLPLASIAQTSGRPTERTAPSRNSCRTGGRERAGQAVRPGSAPAHPADGRRAVQVSPSCYSSDVGSSEDKDRDLLLRAAFDVLLQRDISLSRRVYTWLLGTAETSEEHIAYFQQNGLDALVAALQGDMALNPTSQRPFKTFLALLDKWEPGSLLAPRLVMPGLRALWTASRTADAETRAEVCYSIEYG